jgi:exonuclease SbcD
MYEIDRNDEARAFLAWLKEQIIANGAEALVIAGDIYDKINPPNEAKKIFHNFLASIQGTCCKNVFVTGGNHDSGDLLDSEKQILSSLNIHVVGQISNITPEDMVFEVTGSDGKAAGICAAVPYASENELRNYFDQATEAGTFSDLAYGTLYSKVLEAAKNLRGNRELPIIATGHLYAADLEGRRKTLNQNDKLDDGIRSLDVVGNLGTVSASVFPDEFNYVALGHIHYSTTVGGNKNITYSGSPFVMGFDETNIQRYVNLVDIQLDKNSPSKIEFNTAVTKIPVPESICFRRIFGNCATARAELVKFIQNPPQKETYIEINYLPESGIDIHYQLEDLIENLPKNVSVVSWKVKTSEDVLKYGMPDVGMAELKTFDEEEIFKLRVRAKNPDLSEQEIDSKIERLLPLFMEIANGNFNGDEE